MAAVLGARPDRGGPRARHCRDLCRDPEWIRGRRELEDDGTCAAHAQLFSLLTLSIVVGATNSTLSFFRGSAHARTEPGNNYMAPYYAPYALPPDWDGEPVQRLRARRADE